MPPRARILPSQKYFGSLSAARSALGPQILFRKFVTQVGTNWNQLIVEMGQWYQFGRDLENAINSMGKRTLELVG
jgi:hypothetical protein